MDLHELKALLPKHKHDIESVDRLRELGFPTIEPIITGIIEWVVDGNWPVARPLQSLLIDIGKPIAPYLKEFLSGDDDTGKYFVISGVIGQSRELTETLVSDLLRISKNPTDQERIEGVAEVASEVLEEYGLVFEDETSE